MKKNLVCCFAFCFVSCYTRFQTVPTRYNYSNSVSFTIDKVEEGHTIAVGNGSYNSKRGSKFVFVYMTFTNASQEKQDLNFHEFYLLNPRNKTKYGVEWAMMLGPVNVFANLNSNIAKDDKKKRKLVFIFPEEDKAQKLMVKDSIVGIHYVN